MKEALRVWQSFYCEGAHRRCERYKLWSSGMKVPEKLLPNGRLLESDELARGDAPPCTPAPTET